MDSYNILIVDDVSENIKVAINILQDERYNFSFALGGKQAIEVLRTKRFDLVLLDISLLYESTIGIRTHRNF
jgi:putative two-component system response regulator